MTNCQLPKKSKQNYTLTSHVSMKNTENLRVLLAEDDPINQTLAVALLEENNIEVVVAENGEQVLDLVDKSCFDAVLMDIQMPIKDGLEATRLIREKEKHTGEHLPIIAITAHAIHGDREQCLKAGMDDYISKPFKVGDLLDKMQKNVPS